MEYSVNRHDNLYDLNLSGTFTFSDNAKFRHIVTSMSEQQAAAVKLNLQGLQFIDSAALGMLLLLHDEAGKRGMPVILSGAEGQIKKMLQLSNFEQLFTIE